MLINGFPMLSEERCYNCSTLFYKKLLMNISFCRTGN